MNGQYFIEFIQGDICKKKQSLLDESSSDEEWKEGENGYTSMSVPKENKPIGSLLASEEKTGFSRLLEAL
jgi:hypothetical protein